MRGARAMLVGTAAVVVIATAVAVAHRSPGDQAARLASAPLPTTTTSTTSTTSTTVPPPPTTVSAAPAQVVAACVPDPLPIAPATSDLATTNGAAVAYARSAGGAAIGQLAASTWGGPTVRPVLGSAPGWVEVALDTRPNGSAAWVPQQAVTVSETAYYIVVSTCRRTLTVFQAGAAVYSAPVGVGVAGSPTPLGLSFVDAFVATPKSQLGVYGPEVVIIGSHSNVYTDFDGGDGTVALHEYPSDPASTQGVASSHGCVRISPQTLVQLQAVPVGTPIDIVN